MVVDIKIRTKVQVDGAFLDVHGSIPAIGSAIQGPVEGPRIVLTRPTFDGYQTLPARRFASFIGKHTNVWRCLAISLDYTPILHIWGRRTGWLTQTVNYEEFVENFGVFVPRIGLYLPAVFVISKSDRLLYSEICIRLDGRLDFDSAQKAVMDHLEQ